jgi:hypothetical protein
MAINKSSTKVISPNLYDSYLEEKQNEKLEIKEALIKVEEDMCQLKSLLSQIASLTCKKNVS